MVHFGKIQTMGLSKVSKKRIICIKSSDFSQWEQAATHARLLERIMISERERSEGLSVDAFEVTESLRIKYNL